MSERDSPFTLTRKCPDGRVCNVLPGILFTHWIADSLTLWSSPLTDDHLRTAAIYYTSYASLPSHMVWAVVAVGTFGASCLLASLREGEAGNLMFDGASICEHSMQVLLISCLTCLSFFSLVHERRHRIWAVRHPE